MTGRARPALAVVPPRPGPTRRVLEHQVPLDAPSRLVLPLDARVVHTGYLDDHTDGDLVLWVEHPTHAPHTWTARTFEVFGTGHTIPAGAVHVGTVVRGPFVWHVYEVHRQLTAAPR